MSEVMPQYEFAIIRPLYCPLISDVPAATAILDHFLHYPRIIAITDRSYGLKAPALKETACASEQQWM